MARLILLLALLFIAWWLWQRRPRRRPPIVNTTEPAEVPMVRCQYCGMHVPRDNAVSRNDQWYCCREHAQRELPPEQH